MEVFVSSLSGNDANPGTFQQPKRTLASIVTLFSTAGSIIHMEGTFYEEPTAFAGGQVWSGYGAGARIDGSRDLIREKAVFASAGANLWTLAYKPKYGVVRVVSINGGARAVVKSDPTQCVAQNDVAYAAGILTVYSTTDPSRFSSIRLDDRNGPRATNAPDFSITDIISTWTRQGILITSAPRCHMTRFSSISTGGGGIVVAAGSHDGQADNCVSDGAGLPGINGAHGVMLGQGSVGADVTGWIFNGGSFRNSGQDNIQEYSIATTGDALTLNNVQTQNATVNELDCKGKRPVKVNGGSFKSGPASTDAAITLHINAKDFTISDATVSARTASSGRTSQQAMIVDTGVKVHSTRTRYLAHRGQAVQMLTNAGDSDFTADEMIKSGAGNESGGATAIFFSSHGNHTLKQCTVAPGAIGIDANAVEVQGGAVKLLNMEMETRPAHDGYYVFRASVAGGLDPASDHNALYSTRANWMSLTTGTKTQADVLAGACGTHPVTGDPQFANRAGGDFSIPATSPGYRNGANLGVTKGVNGKAFTNPPNRGAVP